MSDALTLMLSAAIFTFPFTCWIPFTDVVSPSCPGTSPNVIFLCPSTSSTVAVGCPPTATACASTVIPVMAAAAAAAPAAAVPAFSAASFADASAVPASAAAFSAAVAAAIACAAAVAPAAAASSAASCASFTSASASVILAFSVASAPARSSAICCRAVAASCCTSSIWLFAAVIWSYSVFCAAVSSASMSAFALATVASISASSSFIRASCAAISSSSVWITVGYCCSTCVSVSGTFVTVAVKMLDDHTTLSAPTICTYTSMSCAMRVSVSETSQYHSPALVPCTHVTISAFSVFPIHFAYTICPSSICGIVKITRSERLSPRVPSSIFCGTAFFPSNRILFLISIVLPPVVYAFAAVSSVCTRLRSSCTSFSNIGINSS